jgi:MFS family permease
MFQIAYRRLLNGNVGSRFLAFTVLPHRSMTPEGACLTTSIPQRLDRLPWSSWHRKMVIALGITWLLDGLEVTMAGALASILKEPGALGLSNVQVGATATAYLAGAVIGALVFGWLTDRFGRKKLFFVTLGLYVAATGATAFAWDFWSFVVFRALTGLGIGGEYAAINSAIDELIPAAVRGTVDLIINATFWIGAALGSLGTLFLLGSGLLPPTFGWRFAFGIGAVLGLIILRLRRFVPESPRWLLLRGYKEEAEQIVQSIEAAVKQEKGPLPEPHGSLSLRVRSHTPLREVWRAMTSSQPRRSILGLILMSSQAFFYNAIFFTYGLVLTQFLHVDSRRVPLYLLPLALGNFAGPVFLGRFFDSVGRRQMISGTYAASGTLLVIAAINFRHSDASALGQAVWFSIISFIASSAASSAYLTVSEIFPLEIRAFAISVFYAAGTLSGGVGAPLLFGHLIETGSRAAVFKGYVAGGLFMMVGAGAEVLFGVDAARRSLESIASPLQTVCDPGEESAA